MMSNKVTNVGVEQLWKWTTTTKMEQLGKGTTTARVE